MDETNSTQERTNDYADRMRARLANGEAWMMCNECGGKLWSFDGTCDSDRACPFKRSGRCEPPTNRF